MARLRTIWCGLCILVVCSVCVLINKCSVLDIRDDLLIDNNKSHVVVITQFPLMTDPELNLSRYRSANHTVLMARMTDYLEALHKTVNHACVKEVHVLYDQEGMPDYIKSHFGRHSKLKLQRISNAYTLISTFDFVHKHFQNQLVMVTNGDVYPGEGLEKLDFEHMKSKRLLYSPSTHTQAERRCNSSENRCTNYIGSHDSYIFVPRGAIPRRGRGQLVYHWDDLGVESLILKMYMNHLSYVLWNPCLTVLLYHVHCSGLRHSDRPERILYPKGILRLPSRRELI